MDKWWFQPWPLHSQILIDIVWPLLKWTSPNEDPIDNLWFPALASPWLGSEILSPFSKRYFFNSDSIDKWWFSESGIFMARFWDSVPAHEFSSRRLRSVAPPPSIFAIHSWFDLCMLLPIATFYHRLSYGIAYSRILSYIAVAYRTGSNIVAHIVYNRTL